MDLKEQVFALADRCSTLERMHHTDQQIRFFASLPRTKLDINQVVDKCQDPDYHQDLFCHRELPVLAAHMIAMIDNFPSGLFAMRHVANVRRVLTQVFSDIANHPSPESTDQQISFLKCIDAALTQLEPVVQTLAMGVLELRKLLTIQKASGKKPKGLRSLHNVPLLQESLDEFYLALVQFKFLALQLQTCAATNVTQQKGCIGIVSTAIDLVQVARRAARNAAAVCTEHHGDCPEIDIIVADGADGRAYINHLDDHLDYILVELLKNSLRATVDAHMKRNSLGFVDCEDMPHIRVLIATNHSRQFATVIVSDEGGGIPREDMPKIMSYTFTSAGKSAIETASEDGVVEPTLLAGYGYGLPMSRIHARLFGGDVTLQSVEGYGTDAYLFLKKKG